MKDSIVFYKSFYECLKEFPNELQAEVYKAIFEKYFYDNEIELTGQAKGIFSLIKPNIDSANKRYFANLENGKKGGAPKGNSNAKKTTQKQPKNNPTDNPKTSKNNLNDNDNVNVNDNDNDNVNDNNYYIVEQVINYMNKLAGTSFSSTTKKTQQMINARLKEGFTLDDFKDVIYSKYEEWYVKDKIWNNGQHSKDYYRPNTLFSTNFESYLEKYRQEIKGEENG